jgi:hypothetical protein
VPPICFPSPPLPNSLVEKFDIMQHHTSKRYVVALIQFRFNNFNQPALPEKSTVSSRYVRLDHEFAVRDDIGHVGGVDLPGAINVLIQCLVSNIQTFLTKFDEEEARPLELFLQILL